MSWNFHGTLHMGSENLDYQLEKLHRRPRRQRVAAVFLIGLAVVVVAVASVATPAANVTATVTGTGTLASGQTRLDVEYVDPVTGVLQDVSAVLPHGMSAADHPSGTPLAIFAGTDDVGAPTAEIPQTHLLEGLLFGLLLLAGAALLLRAARRNARRAVSANRSDYRLIPGPAMGKRPIP